MRRFLASVSSLALGLAPGVGVGASLPLSIVVQSGTGSSCPYPVSGNDPCAQAPAPATAYWYHPDFFSPGGYANTNAATKANYSATRPQFNVPGVDYGIGPTTPISAHLDPAVNPPTGCVYTTATSTLVGTATGAGMLICGGNVPPYTSWNGAASHINFGPIGGHGCTAFYYRNTPGVSTYVMDDDYGLNDNGKCSIAPGSTVWMHIGTTPLTISNSYFDGNWLAWRTGPPDCPTCNVDSIVGFGPSTGQVTIKYSVFNHFAGRTMGLGFAAGFGLQMIGSWVEGYCSSTLNGHCEWMLGPGGGGIIDHGFAVSYDVLMQDWQGENFGPVPIFTAAGYPVNYSNVTGGPAISLDHNTLINAYIGGAASHAGASFSGCEGATITSAGVCQGSGPYFFETTRHPNADGVVAPAFSGALFSCGSAGNVSLVPGTQVTPPPPGALSQWLYDNSSTFAPVNTGPAVCPTATIYPNVSSYSFAQFQGVFGPVQVVNNFMDVSSQPGYPSAPPLFWVSAGGTGTLSGTGAISGTTLTTSVSQTIGKGTYLYSSNLCSTSDYSKCPMVTATATGTSFQVTPGFSTAAETLTWVNPTICSTPMVFSGNTDLVTGLAPANFNQPSSAASPLIVGCQ